ncbi:O-methyltransferase [Alkalihalobacterium bogoriense]|uniref:O-methyltransferase n=1 Tax=Alkalihalobacterium bogoriense TaxID=246272 RepID=UPI00047AFAE4|nr:O-methyltransferase [Alkalihalobacterium bogoriense]
MISNDVQTYLETLLPTRNALLIEMEQYAKEHRVPIMELIGIESMLQIVKLAQPKRIIEIGTAIGYSAIRMAEAVPQCDIVTIERDQNRIQVAKQFIQRADLEARISILEGDALEIVEKLEKHLKYDVLFIDAAKGQYQRFFELYTPLLTERGVIISDNVLFKGFVANLEKTEQKRQKGIATKLSHYNEWLIQHPQYDTTILPIGDGIAISIKRGESR